MPETIRRDKIPVVIKELEPYIQRAMECNVIEDGTIPFWKLIIYLCELVKSGKMGMYNIKFKNGMVFEPRILDEKIPLSNQYHSIEQRFR